MRKNIEAVISVIKNNGKTEFSISGKLYQEELKELSAAIKENPTIKHVTFSSIQFYMTDMFKQDVLRQDMLPKYIAGILLKGNVSLEMINLSGNHIEDDGILYVIEALKNNETLKHLNLSRNLISNKGGKS